MFRKNQIFGTVLALCLILSMIGCAAAMSSSAVGTNFSIGTGNNMGNGDGWPSYTYSDEMPSTNWTNWTTYTPVSSSSQVVTANDTSTTDGSSFASTQVAISSSTPA